MDIILDTSVIIEIFGGNEQIHTYLSRYKDAVFGISAITEFELNCVDLKEKEIIMMNNLPTCDFDKAVELLEKSGEPGVFVWAPRLKGWLKEPDYIFWLGTVR